MSAIAAAIIFLGVMVYEGCRSISKAIDRTTKTDGESA